MSKTKIHKCESRYTTIAVSFDKETDEMLEKYFHENPGMKKSIFYRNAIKEKLLREAS